jgi:hypothetical protein
VEVDWNGRLQSGVAKGKADRKEKLVGFEFLFMGNGLLASTSSGGRPI